MSLGFAACGGDDDEGEDPPKEKFVWEGDIEGYNPLQGLWRYANKVGLYFSEDKILYRVDFGDNDQDYTMSSPSKFEINKNAFKYGVNSIRRYKLEGDALLIYPNQNDDEDSEVLRRIKEE